MIFFRRLFRGDRIKFSERAAKDLPSPGYDATDRYQDFSRVFGSSTGRRVLAQILYRCDVWGRSYVPGDTHETARREGARDIGLWLMETINFEPADMPDRTETEEPDVS